MLNLLINLSSKVKFFKKILKKRKKIIIIVLFVIALIIVISQIRIDNVEKKAKINKEVIFKQKNNIACRDIEDEIEFINCSNNARKK